MARRTTYVDETLTPQIAGGRTRIQRTYWQAARRRLVRDPVSMGCISILSLMVAAAIFAPWITPHDPYVTSIVNRLKPVGTPGYLLGTDELGRDMLTRLIYGGRISLLMGLLPIAVATLFGSVLGVVAGYFGGKTNMIIMRVADVFFAFPSVLLAVGLAGALGAGVVNVLISLSLVFIPPITRVAEAATTQIRTQDFVEAARATGASAPRIIIGHVMTNVSSPILTYASSLIGLSIVLASGLSFLGLGMSPPLADWGLMLNTLRQSIYLAPVNAVLPGVMILIASVCFNLLSDGLRTAMDVKP
ncbi:MAG: ABC transporter permease subunit [Alphaproteobacteria bacterium]|nr:ABC transporter permease subunit [Alphaproteobacteria bacterium]